MIYKGKFADINGNKYEVNITTEKQGSTKELILGSEPVIIDCQGGEILYKECKYSTATIQVVTGDYLFDLYASKAQQNKVTIKDENDNIVWVGYLTPNLYNMGYEKVLEEIELEAIDSLSTLQYFNYNPIDGENKDIVSFHSLIIHLLKRCNSYTNFYFPKVYDNSYFIDKIVISEQDFYDEGGDPMTYQEVLVEVCKFLGLTCIAYKDNVYFLDYDKLSASYYKVNINTGNITNNISLSSTKSICGDDYAENGGQISLDNVYNKVSVKDSLYSFSTIIPPLFDNAVNITSNSDSTLSNTNINETHDAYGEVLGNGGNNAIAFISKVFQTVDNKTSYNNTCAVGVQYYKNPNFKFYDYDNTGKVTYNYTDTKTLHGALMAKFFVKKLDKKETEIDSDIAGLINNESTLEKYFASNDITKLEYDDYLVLYNAVQNHIHNGSTLNYPYFETGVKEGSVLFGGDNAYILITGSLYFNANFRLYGDDNSTNTKDKYPVPNECYFKDVGWDYFVGRMYLTCKLQWGDLYWNGDEWVDEDVAFLLYYNKIGGKYFERLYVEDTVMQEFEVKNNVVFNTGIGEKGYCIKCPSNKLMKGTPKFTMYKPTDLGTGGAFNYATTVVFLKDFEIKAVLGDTSYSDNNESDTEYFNVIDEEFVNKLDTVEFKICTWDNKSPNYSAVGYDNGNGISYLDKVSYDSENYRMEEHYIKRLVTQYSTPSIILNLNLKNNSILPYTVISDKFINNKSFVVDSYSLDLKQNKNMIKLIEKK